MREGVFQALGGAPSAGGEAGGGGADLACFSQKSASRLAIRWVRQPTCRLMSFVWVTAPTD